MQELSLMCSLSMGHKEEHTEKQLLNTKIKHKLPSLLNESNFILMKSKGRSNSELIKQTNKKLEANLIEPE